MDGRGGIGLFGPGTRIKIALGALPTIFQAEVHAIEFCALEVARRKPKGAAIHIMSDSQAALKTLSGNTVDLRLVWDCTYALKQLAKREQSYPNVGTRARGYS